MELSEAKSPISTEILIRGNSHIILFLYVSDLQARFMFYHPGF